MSTLNLKIGASFLNNKGEIVTLMETVTQGGHGYDHGYRWLDAQGCAYDTDGKFVTIGSATGMSMYDLASEVKRQTISDATGNREYVEVVTTTTHEESRPNLLARGWKTVKDHPWWTALGVAGTGATGAGGYYGYQAYRGHSVFPSVDGVVAVAGVARTMASMSWGEIASKLID